MSNPSFIDLVLQGRVLSDEIEDFVGIWHDSESLVEIHEFLGLTFACRKKDPCLGNLPRQSDVRTHGLFLLRAQPGGLGIRMAMILIVEDEIFIRQNAEWMMEDMGHQTMVAGNLGEAIVHLSAAATIDALFVDIRLHELALGGYDVANQAVELRPELRVLYTSGTPLTAAMTDQFVPGGRFLQKPYFHEQLGTSMEQLLA